MRPSSATAQSANPRSSTALRQPARSATVVFGALVIFSTHWLDYDHELIVARHGQLQLFTTERFDARMRSERALLDLQPPPVDLQPVELAVQALGFDEQLPRPMLDIDDPDAGSDDARSEHEHAGDVE